MPITAAPEAFTVEELARRLNLPQSSIRIAVANGLIECDLSEIWRNKSPIISLTAAVEFCIAVGLHPSRVMR